MWDLHPHTAHVEELSHIQSWDSPFKGDRAPHRDLVLSRILRRPTLVNRAAATHGIANCYTHGTTDLVIEWCCGDSLNSMFGALLAHGMIDGLPPAEAAELYPASNTALLGNRSLVLRRHDSCMIHVGQAHLAAMACSVCD